ncbi:MAG: DUF1398 family protein [Candidatus Altimarinota bacterium]
MFTLPDIINAHAKVKSGADFPAYAREITRMGVTAYDVYVTDGRAVYFGNPDPLNAPGKYEPLLISLDIKKDFFIERLKLHQNGGTDYMTFCRDCAESGVEKWTLDMKAGTCTYYDRSGNELIVEHFPNN